MLKLKAQKNRTKLFQKKKKKKVRLKLSHIKILCENKCTL